MEETKNFQISPYTGLTRESWVQAGKTLLNGALCGVKNVNDPIVLPRSEYAASYPHLRVSADQAEQEESAARFEALARTFFIAAPLICNDEKTRVKDLELKEYYKTQILRAVTKTDELYVGNYEYRQGRWEKPDPNHCYQQTVEGGALAVGLWLCRDTIWKEYKKEEKDRVAAFLSSYAHAHTVPGNWRLFNMLMLAFLHYAGYPIDEEIMADHAQSVLAYYAGDGWYRDGHAFDYYNAWGFQFYAPIWNAVYGYRNMPAIAQKFEENSNRFMKTYADFFDRDGYMNLWGRSGIYRFAVVSAFAGNLFLKNPQMNFGYARKVASGCLRQFFDRKEFLKNGVPTLGFYGEFLPAVQGYSCVGSVYWLGKAFLLLCFPEDHPFWREKENNGVWETLKNEEVKETVLNAPALAVSDHNANGSVILRTGKVVKQRGDTSGMQLYGRLCYHTKYPVEMLREQAVEAQQYVLRDDSDGGVYRRANVILWHGEKKGVLYRRQFFDYDMVHTNHWLQAIDLADFPVPYGIFRADKLRLYRRPVEITLGSYGFPDFGVSVERRERNGAKAVILKGKDSLGREKQTAMTVFGDWSEMKIVRSKGTNADSENSVTIAAVTSRRKEYGCENYLLISQTLTKESFEPFSEKELFPLKSVVTEDDCGCAAFGTTRLIFKNGTEKAIDFTGIEGNLQL